MKRRHFLGAATAGAAAAMWPSWLRQAFADAPACESQTAQTAGKVGKVGEVASSFRAAQRAGRPLLVLVIPAADDAKYERGQAFGELLNFGRDADLAPLASAEVLCATMEALATVVPGVGAGEPLMVLVDTSQVPARVRRLDAPLRVARPVEAGDESYEQTQARESAAADARIETLARLLRSGLGDGKNTARRATEVRERLVKKAPVGGRWAVSQGCGTHVEGAEDNMAIGCGMGHVPEKSRRFLYFFSSASRRF